jgi:hypothetical protein
MDGPRPGKVTRRHGVEARGEVAVEVADPAGDPGLEGVRWVPQRQGSAETGP